MPKREKIPVGSLVVLRKKLRPAQRDRMVWLRRETDPSTTQDVRADFIDVPMLYLGKVVVQPDGPHAPKQKYHRFLHNGSVWRMNARGGFAHAEDWFEVATNE